MPLFSDPCLYRFVLENVDMFFPKSLEFLNWNCKNKKKIIVFFLLALMMEGSTKLSKCQGLMCILDVSTLSGQFLEKFWWKKQSNSILKSLPFFLSKEHWHQK